MWYAKQIDETGVVIAVHSMDRPFPEEAVDFIPITEEEYLVLLAEIEESLKPEPTDEISDTEALMIITGGAV